MTRPSTWWKVAINFRSLENGSRPTSGHLAARADRSTPTRVAAASMARSTGSTRIAVPAGEVAGWNRLARAAASKARRTAGGASNVTALPPGIAASMPAAWIRTTAISPEVSVRVLSVQTIVVDPRDSTAGSRRTSAWRRAMRCMPTASAIVATAGSASGTAAMASAMAVSITSSIGRPCRTPRRPTPAAMAIVAHTSLRPSASSLRSRGVRSTVTLPTSVPIRPTSVSAPVLVITAWPSPPTMVVPMYTMFWRSASGVSSGRTSTYVLLTGSDSPVSGASSMRRSAARTRRPSPGTDRPASSSTMSPGTRSRAGKARKTPLRTTDTCATSREIRLSIARRARNSVRNPINVLTTSTAAMASASIRSPKAIEIAMAATSR